MIMNTMLMILVVLCLQEHHATSGAPSIFISYFWYRFINDQHFVTYGPVRRPHLNTTDLKEDTFRDIYPTFGFKVCMMRYHNPNYWIRTL